MKHARRVEVQGTVAAGFESVRDLFSKNVARYIERQNQLCIYVAGEMVVDLWSTTEANENFSPDSLVNIFSSGKSLEALALAWLHARNRIQYDATIASYWPEFAAQGKAELTVADMMRHELGLASFDTSIPLPALHREQIKANTIGKIIEQQQSVFRQASKREYHALTRGWVANEVFRRCDEQQRTIGEFLQDEICTPLNIQAHVGLSQDQLAQRVPVQPIGFGRTLRESLTPTLMGRRMENNFWQLSARLAPLIGGMRDRSRARPPMPLIDPAGRAKGIGIFNLDDMAQGETPSANTHSNARSLAKLAAMFAARGNWQGEQILDENTWEAMHSAPEDADMGFAHTTFTQGGVAKFGGLPTPASRLDRGLHLGREGFYGWMGLGGSLFQWHPEKRIGFGYVPTSLNVLDLVNERGKVYQQAVVKCLS